MKSELRIKARLPLEKKIESFIKFSHLSSPIDVGVVLITDKTLDFVFDPQNKAESKFVVPEYVKSRVYDNFGNRIEENIFIHDRNWSFIDAFGFDSKDLIDVLFRPKWDKEGKYIYFTTSIKPISDFLLNARKDGKHLFDAVIVEDKPERLTDWEQLQLREDVLEAIKTRFEDIASLLKATREEILEVKKVGQATYLVIKMWQDNERYYV